MNVLPQAPSKIEVKNQDLTGPADREILSNEFSDSLKKGLEKEDAKKAASAAAASALAAQQGPIPLKPAKTPVAESAPDDSAVKADPKFDLKANPKAGVPSPSGVESLLAEKSGAMSGPLNESLNEPLNESLSDGISIPLARGQGNVKASGKEMASVLSEAPARQTESELKQSVRSFIESRNGLQNQNGASGSQDVVPSAILQSMMGEGIDTSKLDGFEHDFDVESLEVKDFSKGVAENRSANASSKLSTSDYLSLREISRKPDQGLDLGTSGKPNLKKEKSLNPLLANGKEDMSFASGLQQSFQLNQHHGKTVEAPTTQNALGKTILSQESVQQVAGQVNQLSQARQDGEIKIRLRPDHLGELMMNVKTQGHQVAIQIKAHDGESKKIIEESLGALRDSLSKQNLSLSQVEVVTQPQASSGDQTAQMDTSGQRQNFGQDGSSGYRDENRNQNGRQERLYEDNLAQGSLSMGRISRPIRSGGTQGLDLIA
jgi:flagellar hook-length control protein FliK